MSENSGYVRIGVGEAYNMPINNEMYKTMDMACNALLFLEDANYIQVVVKNPSQRDIKEINEAPIYAGLLADNPLLMLYFEFGKIFLECPFDSHVISDDHLFIPNKLNPEMRLAIAFHFIDADTKKVIGLRYATLDKDMTTSLLSAVMDQRVNYSSERFIEKHQKLMSIPPEVCMANIERRLMGL
ncbi:conserved hypothetical protein [Vibrio chagasii]|nr:conserved hypothetical protein [Vibrio chagasii]